jgi:hypothetical protein
MKTLAALFLSLALLSGCKTVTVPPGPVAPGYSNSTDQQVGQSLSALRASVYQATQDYAKLTPAQQSAEKAALNSFVTAVNLADSTYTAFHAGQATLAQSQTALADATASQTAFVQGAK